MRAEYKAENDILFRSFLNSYFFRFWTKEGSKRDKYVGAYERGIEVFPTDSCNLACSYCYLKNFGDELFYNKYSKKPENALNNLRMLTDWLKENEYVPDKIEVFSGDFFSLSYWEKYFQIIYDWLASIEDKDEYWPWMNKGMFTIMMPTNASFIDNDEKTEKIEGWLEKFKEIRVRLSLSLSFDGKVIDEISRPYRNKKKHYTDEFYDKVFQFSRKHRCGMHPMLSSKNVHYWIENFKWFESMFEKHGGSKKDAIEKLFVLEVRNPDWTKKDLKALMEFTTWTVEHAYELYDGDPAAMFESLIAKSSLQYIRSPFGYTARGMMCSIQNDFLVRGDLTFGNCHRLGQEGYEGGRFIVEDGKITGIESINPELYMTVKTFNFREGPLCSNCPIKYICTGYCIGANYEMNGEYFAPVPTVCELEHVKAGAAVRALDKYGIVDYMIRRYSRSSWVNRRQVGAIEYLRDAYRDRPLSDK